MCTKFRMVLMLLVLPKEAGWMINREYLDEVNFMVILALSLPVWSTSFMPGLSDIVFRPYTSLEASQFEQKWSRFAPLSITMKCSRKKALWYGKMVLLLSQIHYQYSDNRNNNRMRTNNTPLSLKGLDGVRLVPFSVPRPCIQTVPNSKAYSSSTI